MFPIGPIIALVLCVVVTLGQGITCFTGDSIDWKGAIAAYIGVPLFFGLWIIYKFKYKTQVVKLTDIDFDDISK